LNAVGDRHGTPFKDGAVTTPPGWKDAYRSWAAAGWNGLSGPAEWGGQDLPLAVNAPATTCGTPARWLSSSDPC
jgi:butyryl-CoA dehydrogenase